MAGDKTLMDAANNDAAQDDINQDNSLDSMGDMGGAFADGLTLIRIGLTPVIMALIIMAWPETRIALLASMLFLIAALTDIFDDFFGGTEMSVFRRYGFLDDIADTILCTGTLIALLWVTYNAGILAWPFAVPAGIIILREGLVALIKGRAIIRFGWPDNFLSNAKSAMIMLATCILVASPWLTQFYDNFRANSENIVQLYNSGSPHIWLLGEIFLWIGALLSVLSGLKILTTSFGAHHE